MNENNNNNLINQLHDTSHELQKLRNGLEGGHSSQSANNQQQNQQQKGGSNNTGQQNGNNTGQQNGNNTGQQNGNNTGQQNGNNTGSQNGNNTGQQLDPKAEKERKRQEFLERQKENEAKLKNAVDKEMIEYDQAHNKEAKFLDGTSLIKSGIVSVLAAAIGFLIIGNLFALCFLALGIVVYELEYRRRKSTQKSFVKQLQKERTANKIAAQNLA